MMSAATISPRSKGGLALGSESCSPQLCRAIAALDSHTGLKTIAFDPKKGRVYTRRRFRPEFIAGPGRPAGVVELVDTLDLGSSGLRRGGSNPSARTIGGPARRPAAFRRNGPGGAQRM